MRIPPVKAIVAFESVARTKSVNRASEELGLTASAENAELPRVTRFIAWIEREVGRMERKA